MTVTETESPPRITVDKLSYQFPDGSTGLQDVFLDLPAGSRTLLIGGMSPRATFLLR